MPIRPEGGKPKHAGRNLRRRSDRVLERHAERVEIADGLDHRERAPRKRAGRAARDTVA